MKKHTTSTAIPTHALKAEALASMSASFERFCLAAGLETLSEMLEQDATAACGERHERGKRRQAHRYAAARPVRIAEILGLAAGEVDNPCLGIVGSLPDRGRSSSAASAP